MLSKFEDNFNGKLIIKHNAQLDTFLAMMKNYLAFILFSNKKFVELSERLIINCFAQTLIATINY